MTPCTSGEVQSACMDVYMDDFDLLMSEHNILEMGAEAKHLPQQQLTCEAGDSVTRNFRNTLTAAITSMAADVATNHGTEIGFIYEQMEAAVVTQIPTDLEHEVTPMCMQTEAGSRGWSQRREDSLRHLVATPQMMREFAAKVAASPPLASC